jgi:hypothetical protein
MAPSSLEYFLSRESKVLKEKRFFLQILYISNICQSPNNSVCILILIVNSNNLTCYIIFYQDWITINWLIDTKSILFMAHMTWTYIIKNPCVIKTTIGNANYMDKFWTINFFFNNTNHRRGTWLIIFPFIFQLQTLNFVVPKVDVSKAETNIFKLF